LLASSLRPDAAVDSRSTRVIGQINHCAANQGFFQRFDNFPDTAFLAGRAVRQQHYVLLSSYAERYRFAFTRETHGLPVVSIVRYTLPLAVFMPHEQHLLISRRILKVLKRGHAF
jgi:hypothetical protein